MWAPSCAAAEIGSKWALLCGDQILDRLPAILVRDGSIVTNLATDVLD